MHNIKEITCPICKGIGVIPVLVPQYAYVTRDMALDAEDENLEGQRMEVDRLQYELCSGCGGTGLVEIE